jgi:DNA-binding NtrC family response regulator
MGFHEARRQWEREYWSELIERHRGNITHAAEEAGVNRQGVYYLLQRLGIDLGGLLGRPHRGGNDAWHSLKG